MPADEETCHLLDRWVTSLKPVECGGIRAWVVEQPPVGNDADLHGLSGFQELCLRRMICRPSRDDIEQYLAHLKDQELEDQELYDVARCSVESLLAGCRTEVVAPSSGEWSITYSFESGMTSGSFSQFALTFNHELAVVCDDQNEDDYGTFPYWAPLGLVTRDQIFRSTALLFMRGGGGSVFTGMMPDEIGAGGIPLVELYRILLAQGRHGGDAVVNMSAFELLQVKDEGMVGGFDDLLDCIELSDFVKKRFKKPARYRHLPTHLAVMVIEGQLSEEEARKLAAAGGTRA